MSDFTNVKRPESADPQGTDGPRAAPSPPASGARRGGLKAVVVAAVAVVAFGAGVILGAGYMGLMGYHLSPLAAAAPSGGAPTGGAAGMPPAPAGVGGVGGAGAVRAAARGPSAKVQLAQLVAKLDVLTDKPLSVQLSAGQRKEIQEQLKGLVDAKELSDDDAKARLDKVLDLLKDQKETFEAAGYRWPGEGNPGGGPPGGPGRDQPANPFTNDANAGHLKSLSERLEKGGNG